MPNRITIFITDELELFIVPKETKKTATYEKQMAV